MVTQSTDKHVKYQATYQAYQLSFSSQSNLFIKDSAFLCSKKVLKGLCVQYPHFSRANPNVWPVLKSLTNCRQIQDLFSLRKAVGNKIIPYWGVVVTGEAEGKQKNVAKQPRYLSAVEALIKTCEDPWKRKSVQILQTALVARSYGGGRGCSSECYRVVSFSVLSAQMNPRFYSVLRDIHQIATIFLSLRNLTQITSMTAI